MTGDAHPGWPVEGRPVIRRAPGVGGGGRTGVWAEGLDDPDVAPTRRWSPGRSAGGERAEALLDLRPLLVCLGVLVVALGGLLWLGRTPLVSPPVRDPAAWWQWAQTATTDQIAFNLLRLCGLAVSWYLLGVTTVGAVARLADLRGLVRVADRLTVGPVRQLLQVSLGLTLATGAVIQVPGAGSPRPTAPVVAASSSSTPEGASGAGRTQPVVPGAIGQRTVTTADVDQALVTEVALIDARPVAHDGWTGLLESASVADTEGSLMARDPAVVDAVGARRAGTGEERTGLEENPSIADADASSDVTTTHVAAPEPSGATPDRITRVVAAGDHFWSIASDVIGNEADDADIARYWETLVNVNRDRLVDPANPDLLLPGQVLVIPVLPA